MKSSSDPAERALLADRAVIVKRLKTVPLEAVVRGYVIGSGWKDYQKTGAISGIKLPAGPQAGGEAAADAVHAVHQGGHRRSRRDHQLRNGGADSSAPNSRRACATPPSRCTNSRRRMRATRGIIIADTKFEFALGADGELVLIDEVLTPDSSRFWPADTYREGISPPSFDKQFVRDYLETLDWNKQAPAPKLPAEIIAKTSAKYVEALTRLTRRLNAGRPHFRAPLARCAWISRSAIGQRRGSRLQDDRRLDLVELPVAHRRHLGPAWRVRPRSPGGISCRTMSRKSRRVRGAALRADPR